MSATIETPFPNQPPPYADRNLYADDRRAGRKHSRAKAAPGGRRPSRHAGATLGTRRSPRARRRREPQSRRSSRRTTRAASASTRSRFHPAWHELMAHRRPPPACIAAPWTDPGPGAQVARGAMVHLHAQVENGTQCPLTMTYASVPRPAPRRDGDAGARARLAAARSWRAITIRVACRSARKRAALIGMGMTERQGGSDVRSNRTRAPLRRRRRAFGSPATSGSSRRRNATRTSCSRRATPASRASCLPRVLPGRNAQRDPDQPPQGQARQPVERVRGSRVRRRASRGRSATPGRGIATILEMVQHTRLDCVLGDAPA